MIRVVNVRGLNTPEQRKGIVYVGRRCAGWPGHPLANPYKVARNKAHGSEVSSVIEALNQYRRWLDTAWPNRLGKALEQLWLDTDGGRLPLGCWCVDSWHGDGQPVVCHAQILAAMLAERFGGSSPC